MKATITLPWPPSVNAYWRSIPCGRRTKVLISEAGRDYRANVMAAVRERWSRMLKPTAARLGLVVTLCPPDGYRRRDLDNFQKAVWDSMTHAGVWLDDSQIDAFCVLRGPVIESGCVFLEIEVLHGKVKFGGWIPIEEETRSAS